MPASTEPGRTLLLDPGFPALTRKVAELTGMGYWDDKDDALADALAPVLASWNSDAAAFVARISAEAGQGPATEALIEAATVGETFFFRYPDQFKVFEGEVLSDCLARNRGHRSLAVWSAGCSNGAETYSLAIAIRRRVPADWRVRIVGTDIDRHAIDKARAGEYGPWAVRGLSHHRLTECFVSVGNLWRVRDVYREGVEFARHNLVHDDPPMGKFDVVFCRNVLMYFDPQTRSRVLDRLHASLAEGGWLFVAHAEAGPEIGDRFETVRVGGIIAYRRRTMPAQRSKSPGAAAAPPPVPRRVPSRADIQDLLDRGLFAQAAEGARAWIAAEPLAAEAHFVLGLAVEATAPAEARTAFRHAVFLDPKFSLAWFHLSRLSSGDELRRTLDALKASLVGAADRPLEGGDGLTVGDLAAVIRRTGIEERR